MTLTNAILAAVAIVGWLGWWGTMLLLNDRDRRIDALQRRCWLTEQRCNLAMQETRQAERERDDATQARDGLYRMASFRAYPPHPIRHQYWEN